MNPCMMRRLSRLPLAALLLLAVSGCFGEDAEQMLETAKFEELQRNEAHAREIYERILTTHPDSPQAREARTRLDQLDQDSPEAP